MIPYVHASTRPVASPPPDRLDPWGTHREEINLILACARVGDAAVPVRRVQRLAQRPLDWTFVVEAAAYHGVSTMVHDVLFRHAREHVPAPTLAALHARATVDLTCNLQRVAELGRILDAFAEAGIDVIPFKGPVLTQVYYGNPASRSYGDLDLFVRRSEFEAARDLLRSRGFKPLRDLPEDVSETRIDAQYGYELVRKRDNLMVELHWALLHKTLDSGVSEDDLWERSRTISFLPGREVRAFDLRDLVTYLCAHGAKHYWKRLKWVCDVAQVLRQKPPELDEGLLERAEEWHVQREVLLGLHLAHRWLSAPLPSSLQRRVETDRTVLRLANELERHWLFQQDALTRTQRWRQHWFLLRTRRTRDRLPLLADYAKLAVTPSSRDRDLVALPPALKPLYYVLRPVRLLRDAVRRVGAASSRRARWTNVKHSG